MPYDYISIVQHHHTNNNPSTFQPYPKSTQVVVLSGSMEPAFQRGDILFLNNQDDPIRVGEIVVFKIKDR